MPPVFDSNLPLQCANIGHIIISLPSDNSVLRIGGKAGGRLDSQIEDLCRGLEIVGVRPYGSVVIALYEKFLSWKLFQQMTGIFALEECEVTVWLVL